MTPPPVRTHLQVLGEGEIRPARPPRVDVRIEQVDPPDGRVNRAMYEQVGAPHRWLDLRGHDDGWWQVWAEGRETWLALVGGERAGYYELDDRSRPGDVELAYFGLVPAHQGVGLGGHLLEHAMRRAFALPGTRRLWVSTGTLDGPHALANYEARGFIAYRRFEEPPPRARAPRRGGGESPG